MHLHRRGSCHRLARRLAARSSPSSCSPGSSPARAGATAQEWAPPSTVWVEVAGHTVDGLFLDAWRTHSSLLGMPISEETTGAGRLDGLPTAERTIQYFENVALVYTPEDARGGAWQVQALPLGEAALKRDRDQLRRTNLEADGLLRRVVRDVAASSRRRSTRCGWVSRPFGRPTTASVSSACR